MTTDTDNLMCLWCECSSVKAPSNVPCVLEIEIEEKEREQKTKVWRALDGSFPAHCHSQRHLQRTARGRCVSVTCGDVTCFFVLYSESQSMSVSIDCHLPELI